MADDGGKEESSVELPSSRKDERLSMPSDDFGFISSYNPLCQQLNPLIRLGFNRQLEKGDLGTLPAQCKKSYLYDRFKAALNFEINCPENKRSFWRLLIRALGYRRFLCGLLLSYAGAASSFSAPLLLDSVSNKLLGYNNISDGLLWFLIAMVFVAPVTGSICNNQSTLIFNFMAIQVRNVLTNVVYEKICSQKGCDLEAGTLINLVNSDCKNIELLFSTLKSILVVPPIIVAAIILIYQQVGASTFLAIAYLALVVPFGTYMFGRVAALFKERMKLGDKRLKITNEIFTGIRVLKFYGWEAAFLGSVEGVRDAEQQISRKILRIISVAIFSSTSIPYILPVIIFAGYLGIEKRSLHAVQAFVTLQLLMLLQGPLAIIAGSINTISSAQVSADRIMKFLIKRDIEKYVNRHEYGNEDVAIVLKDVYAGWEISKTTNKTDYMKGTETIVSSEREYNEDNDRSIHTLSGLSVSIGRGKVVAIVGSIGSGKSSVLSMLLNEMFLHSGSVSIRGSLSYHQQSPWIFNATLKKNILFESAYNEERLDQVLRVSALNADIDQLPSGMETEIGEKGINLSGGQKARISFARALYADTDIVLLDDPLSAVDAHVGATLFYNGIKTFLKEKTVVLVTHQTQYLKDCDLIIVLDNGQLKTVGTYDDLLNQNLDILRNLGGVKKGESSNDLVNQVSPSTVKRDVSRANKKNDTEKPTADGKKLLTTEYKHKGSVRFNVYWFYISKGKPFIYGLMMFTTLGSQALQNYASIWLATWGSVSYSKTLTSSENFAYLGVYAGLVIGGSFSTFINMNLNLEHRIRSAKAIHKLLLSTFLQSKISFFDVTPLGRLMNVFSNDVKQLDMQVGYALAILLASVGQMIGNVGTLGYTTKGTFLLALVPLLILYSYFQRYYQKTNLEIKRLNSIANSPIVSQFTETLYGITSIRAFALESKMAAALESHVITESTSYYLLGLVSCWKQIRLDAIGALMSLFVYILCASTDNFISPSSFLVAVTYSQALPGLCSMLVNAVSDAESAMNSVERIMQYTSDKNKLEDESEALLNVPADWPNQGKVEFTNIVVGYRDGPDVLKSISLIIRPNERIGIVGRTGSGKSTLLMSLFRFETLRAGSILIDDIDISQISLFSLRSKLAIIPQEPVLWNGTLRFNVDPFYSYTDEQIWSALASVCLKETVENLDGKLSFQVAGSGSNFNFSNGQLQLICFARALLKQAKILVLDEATASVDYETDNLIQTMIKTQFANCTVLTIAHRLNTVIDSDRIIILQDGVLVEADTPDNLLKIPNGVFQSMYSQYQSA